MILKGTSSLQRTAILICVFMITRLFNKSNSFELGIFLSAESDARISIRSKVPSKPFGGESKKPPEMPFGRDFRRLYIDQLVKPSVGMVYYSTVTLFARLRGLSTS